MKHFVELDMFNVVISVIDWSLSFDVREQFPEKNLIEITEQQRASVNHGFVYDGQNFNNPNPPVNTWREKRAAEYPTIQQITMALWNKIMENDSTEADVLKTLRDQVRARYPSQ